MEISDDTFCDSSGRFYTEDDISDMEELNEKIPPLFKVKVLRPNADNIDFHSILSDYFYDIGEEVFDVNSKLIDICAAELASCFNRTFVNTVFYECTNIPIENN